MSIDGPFSMAMLINGILMVFTTHGEIGDDLLPSKLL
jgi:hypothetical protein